MKKITACMLIAGASLFSGAADKDLTQSGNWFDTNLWQNEIIPGADDVVWIDNGVSVEYNQSPETADRSIAALGIGSGTSSSGLSGADALPAEFKLVSGNLAVTSEEGAYFDSEWHYSMGANNALIDLQGGSLTVRNARLATRTNSKTTLNIAENAVFVANSWINFGFKGLCEINQYGNATYDSLVEVGCKDNNSSCGIYNLYDGVMHCKGEYFNLGHYGNERLRGIFNHFGGEAIFDGFFRIGYAQVKGEYNMSGGRTLCKNWTCLGLQAGAAGTLNVSGGVFEVTGGGLNVGEGGKGDVVVCDSGKVSVVNRTHIGPWNSSITLLDGGTLETPFVEGGANEGFASYLTVSGGVLKVMGNNTTVDQFFVNIDHVRVQEAGMVIDVGNNVVSVDFSHDCFELEGPVIKRGLGTLIVTGVKPTLDLRVAEGEIELPYLKPEGSAGLVRRYSFDGNAVDMVTGEAALGVNNVSFTTGADGSCAYFPAGRNGEHEIYFGSNFLPNGELGTTVEIFFRVRGEVPDLTPIFESAGYYGVGFGCGIRMGSDNPQGFINLGGDQHWSWDWTNNEYGRVDNTDKTYCYTLSIKDNEQGFVEGVLYNQNIHDASEHSSVSRICEDRSLKNLDQQWASLGKSFHDWDGRRTPEFEVYELRVWDRAFTQSEAIASALNGPDVIPVRNMLSLAGVSLAVAPGAKINLVGDVDLTGTAISAVGNPEEVAAQVASLHRVPVIETTGRFSGVPDERNLRRYGVKLEIVDGIVYLRPRIGFNVKIR